MKFGMIIGNSFANTHTKFHYNRFLGSEDTSDPRGGVKPEIRRPLRAKCLSSFFSRSPSSSCLEPWWLKLLNDVGLRVGFVWPSCGLRMAPWTHPPPRPPAGPKQNELARPPSARPPSARPPRLNEAIGMGVRRVPFRFSLISPKLMIVATWD